MLHGTITGTIAGLRDYGSLVLVFLDAEDGRVIPVPMDQSGVPAFARRRGVPSLAN